MAIFVAEFANKIGLHKFALAGNSMGGAVAARFAEMYPGRVTSLILVDAGGMPGKMGDRIPLAFQLLRQPWLQSVMAHANPKPLAREGLNKAIVRKAILTEQMIDLYSDMALLEGTRQATFERFNQPGEDYNYVKDHVRALKMPVLILWGEEDHLIPVATAHTWNRSIPGSKLIVYPATGHIPMEEVADQSAADVRLFLAAHQTVD
jgi:pimeloyl-ACP methyl ester carboxylesterase